MAGVFAGGDIVTGAATVIEAMGAGRRAARSMKPTSACASWRDPTMPQRAQRCSGSDVAERNFVRLRARA